MKQIEIIEELKRLEKVFRNNLNTKEDERNLARLLKIRMRYEIKRKSK